MTFEITEWLLPIDTSLLWGSHWTLTCKSTIRGSAVFSSSLRSSINDLREVFGEVYNEDVLNNIFKGFCVGK